MPGSYSGFVIIPAGIDTDDGLYTVTAIGPGALTGKWLTGVLIPHTVTTLDHPFGDYTFDYAPLDSIKFLSTPSRLTGGIPYGALKSLKAKKTYHGWEQIDVFDVKYTVKRMIPDPYLLIVMDRQGKTGALGYDSSRTKILPFEYDDLRYGCEYAALAKKDGRWGVVDYNGNVLIPFTYPIEGKLGRGEKLSKKIGKAFRKFYGRSTDSALEKAHQFAESSELDYLLWLSGYKEEDPEHAVYVSGDDLVLGLMMGLEMIGQFYYPYSRLHEIDSLVRNGKTGEARESYRYYVRYYGFSSVVEELLGRTGGLTYAVRDTSDMDWDGGKYTGQIDEFGIPHGAGTLRKEDSKSKRNYSIFFGSTEEEPSYEFFNADTYRGKWVKGKLYGPCEMVRYNIYVTRDPYRRDSSLSFTFSGYLVGDHLCGDAHMEYPCDNKPDASPVIYTGQLRNWQRNGKGKAYSLTNGWTYEGEWARDRWNGHGKLTYDNGTTVEGGFRNTSFFGDFILTNPDGSVQTGTAGKARYLYLNLKLETELKEDIPHCSSSRSYKVTTDWNGYEISGLPDWITVSDRTSDSFTLDFADNPARDGRTASVTVSAGGRSVTINVTQEGDKYARTGSVTNSWTVSDATRSTGMYMTQGMEVHTAFSLDNLDGRQCQIIVYFEFSNGQKLRDINSSYGTTDGYVATYENFTPPYTSSLYNDYCLYIPYSELHLAPGQHQLRYHVCIFDMSTGKAVATSDYIYFSLTTW